MKVVLLAAGRSKRLKPIEDKNFLNFIGKPLLEHQLNFLADAGGESHNVIVVGGAHNLGKIEELAGDLPYKIEVVEQKNLDEGMAGGVLAAEELVKDEPILIVSANDIVEPEAFKLVMNSKDDESFDSLIVGKEVESYFPGGYLSTDENGLISGIVEKPGAGNEPSNLINIVVHYHRDSRILFEELKKVSSENDDRYEVALNNLIKSGVKMKALPYSGYWQPIKYPWHVFSVMDHFFSKMKGSNENAEISDSAVIRGNVYLAEGVKVMDNAVIQGPAYIGKNSVVASNALVRNSIVGDNCVIGFASEVARSFVGNEVWTHTNYIGDSIIGNNVSFGAGSVTGNLRLDEANIYVNIKGEKTDSGRNKFGLVTGNNVRCGINTSFMPGIKVGNNVCVGAGIIIGEDVPDNKFVYAKTELTLKDNKLDIGKKNREEMKKKLGK